MYKKSKHIIFLLIFLFITSLKAQFITYGTIEPFDETNTDQSFSKFISELKESVANKDADWFCNMVDENIQFSYGGEGPGKKEFRMAWDLNNPESEFWELFSRTLDLGIAKCRDNCDFDDFEFPYYLSSKLFDNLEDVFSILIIVSPDAKVYSLPNENSKILATLRYKVINFLDWENDFFEISWDKKRKACIRETDARRLVCFRGGFKLIKNQWKLVYFLQGD